MATRKQGSTKSSGGRGSREAIEKRRTARQLNALLEGGSKAAPKRDGRTEKRRKRLIQELKNGRGAKHTPLKPMEVVSHANELLEIGETLSTIKKEGVKPRKFEISDEIMQVVDATQAAYDYHPDAWKLIGINLEDKPAKAEKPAKAARGSRKARKSS